MLNNNLLSYTIQENDKTVKNILTLELSFSKRLSKKLEMNGKIFLNGKITKWSKRTKKGDVLTIEFEEEEDEYEPVDIPIEIIYEDNDIIAINKPPYIVVHPTKSHQNNTIANGVAYYFKENNIKRKVRLVNRLDMNTSGVLIIAKNPFAHNELSNQMKNNTVEKYYYAIASGVVENDYGTINEPIARLNDEDIVRVVDPSGKECITHYFVEKRLKEMTLLRLKLETGRTHQIRVHLKHIGHPVLGDTLYGEESGLINRQALHCSKMKINQPFTGEEILLTCDLPADMAIIIN